MKRLTEGGLPKRLDLADTWNRIEDQLKDEKLSLSVFMPAMSLAGFPLAGQPQPAAKKLLTAPAVIASNMMIGTRTMSTGYDFLRYAQANAKKGDVYNITSFLANGGKAPAPFVDTRTCRQERRSPGVWWLPAIPVTRGDARDFRCRLWKEATFTKAW